VSTFAALVRGFRQLREKLLNADCKGLPRARQGIDAWQSIQEAFATVIN
jgi:hypothetical protein